MDGTAMYDTLITSESKSTADVVFDRLHAEIVSLEILPGAKISEAEIARRFGVSRQPVRDHRLICTAAGLPMAFETINRCKMKVARLCVLSLSDDENVAEILDDHLAIADALRRRATQECRSLMREHTRRLSPTIAKIHETHAEYFQ